MSLASRFLGVALSLGGGFLMGQGTGIWAIGTTAFNIIYSSASSNPAVGPFFGYFFGGYVQQQIQGGNVQNQFTTVNGSYWAFGTILAIVGLAIIVRGDRKPRNPEESRPLFQEPMQM